MSKSPSARAAVSGGRHPGACRVQASAAAARPQRHLRSTCPTTTTVAARSSFDKGLAEPTLTYGPLDADAPAEGLLMMLHGAGDSADGMMGLAQEWARQMPRVAFVMPSAPKRGSMSSWFGRVKGKLECTNFETITEQLLALLDAERSRLNLTLGQVALWGYSAGSLMAGWLTLQLEEHCAALVLLHGLAPDKRLPPPPKAPSGLRPPTLCLAGERDLQIPPPAVEKAVQDLRHNGFQNITHHLEPDGTHGISDREMMLMSEFLKAHLQGARLSTEQLKTIGHASASNDGLNACSPL